MAEFNPREHLIQLKSKDGPKDYLQVAWRLVWFREQCPNGTIDTEEVEYDPNREVEAEMSVWNSEKRRYDKIIKGGRGYARYKAIVTDGKGGRATGHKSENAANFADYGEKAETGAVGRALAMLGYGTQFTADELDEAHRIVDSPVDRNPAPVPDTRNGHSNSTMTAVRSGNAPVASNGNGAIQLREPAPAATPDGEAAATEEQLNSIRKLCERLGKTAPENVSSLNYLTACKFLRDLTAEYRAKQQNRAS